VLEVIKIISEVKLTDMNSLCRFQHGSIKTKASKTQNIHVEKGRHTEIKKQDRGNVKQYTGKVQN
jgi:hypothetical protein